uniref:Uncharacterized protein n=1 Tax=Rousettus aegyptiacus TaxID=9407 RepID=A0A7J8CI31_ROUAE|nr:hypothetical protein HJG63_009038 [Rousettus aegyptiacus]
MVVKKETVLNLLSPQAQCREVRQKHSLSVPSGSCQLYQVSALLLPEKGRFDGETPSWKNAHEADMRMKWQAPTLLHGARFCWEVQLYGGGGCSIAHTSTPLFVLPFFSPGDHMAPHIAEYNSGLQPHMRDTIS